jgi:glycosyltransferase involved in cell wall biosynthesis
VKSVRRICYAGTYERDYPRNRLTIQALRDAGVRVEECHRPVFERSPDKSAVGPVAMLAFALRLTFAYLLLIPDVGLRLLRCDALMIGYIGQLDILVLGTVARIAGKPVIFNPLVSLTDTLVEDRKQFGEGSVPATVVRTVDTLSMKMADLVLADTDENADFFVQTFGIDRGRIAVVQVGAPESLFHPAATKPDDDDLDVLFVGKFIPLHGIDTVLQAVAILQERLPQARIELVGTGQDYANARAMAAGLNLRNIVWTDWVPFEHLGNRIRQAAVVLGVFDGGPKAARVIPNKVHHALACGVPVVTRRSPAVERFLTDGESAMLIPPDDPEALACAITRLADADLRQSIGRAGYESWKQWGSREALAKQMTAALAGLAAAR